MPQILLSLLAIFPGSIFGIDYKNDIMPIMKEHCFDCHAGKNYKGNLNLDNLSEMSFHIGKYNVIRPGDTEESSFLEKMHLPESAKDFMPRKGSKLPDEQLAAIADWIKAGAIVDAENPTEKEKEWLQANGISIAGPKGKPTQEFIKWTSNDGKNIEARFLGLKGASVKLLMKNGKAYDVPFTRLSAESVALAKKMGEKN